MPRGFSNATDTGMEYVFCLSAYVSLCVCEVSPFGRCCLFLIAFVLLFVLFALDSFSVCHLSMTDLPPAFARRCRGPRANFYHVMHQLAAS